MKKFLAAALLSSALIPVAFANANAGSILYVCSTPQPNDMVKADFEACAWVQVKSLGNYGETGSKTNILSYDTWDTTVIQKAKGLTDAGAPTAEFARIPTDPGQIIMRAIALTNLNYAFKLVRNDAPVAGGTPTIRYNRGLVTGPTEPNGKNEDFDLEVFTLAFQQAQVTVDPLITGNPPVFTAEPAITGTATHGNVLTVSNGTVTGDATITYTYQWYSGGAVLVGATNNTYLSQLSDVGKIITARVSASNASGSAVGFSAPTAAIS